MLLFYFGLGRLGIMVAVAASLCPALGALAIILPLELIQIPAFDHIFRLVTYLGKRIKGMLHKNKPEAEKAERTPGFLRRKTAALHAYLKSKGMIGVFVLAALPFRGCGVWSSVLMGKSLKYNLRKVYLVVAVAVVVGNGAMVLLGVLFNPLVLSMLDSMNVSPALRALIEKG